MRYSFKKGHQINQHGEDVFYWAIENNEIPKLDPNYWLLSDEQIREFSETPENFLMYKYKPYLDISRCYYIEDNKVKCFLTFPVITDLLTVEKFRNEFKSNHQLTDDDFKKIIDGSIYPEEDYHKLLNREVKGEIFKYASYHTSTTISF